VDARLNFIAELRVMQEMLLAIFIFILNEVITAVSRQVNFLVYNILSVK
jgi:hypothetical protein